MITAAPPPLFVPPKPAIIRAWGKDDVPALIRQGIIFPMFCPSAAVVPVATTFLDTDQSTTNATSHNLAVDLGSPGLYSHIFVGVVSQGSAGGAAATSLTVAGNAATVRAAGVNSQTNSSLWNVAYSAGGAGVTVAVAYAAQVAVVGIVVWGVTGLLSAVPTNGPVSDTTDPISAACNVSVGGAMFWIAGNRASSTATAVGSGLGEAADFVITDGGSFLQVWGGHGDFALGSTGVTFGCDFAGSPFGPVGCGASFR